MSFFKALFIGTCLGAALKRMSHSMAVPDGLKPQECEWDAGWSRLSVCYIPEMDMIQEVMDSTANTLKLTLPQKVELCITVWSKGSPDQFLVHIQQVLYAIRQKSLPMAMRR
jgi:hypothetical protein